MVLFGFFSMMHHWWWEGFIIYHIMMQIWCWGCSAVSQGQICLCLKLSLFILAYIQMQIWEWDFLFCWNPDVGCVPSDWAEGLRDTKVDQEGFICIKGWSQVSCAFSFSGLMQQQLCSHGIVLIQQQVYEASFPFYILLLYEINAVILYNLF